jgi:serine beta-lactamase-like protein LACTB, mitochondrial
MARSRTETWTLLIVLAIGVVPLAIAGLWGFMIYTATPLHPNPQAAPSSAISAPPAEWTNAVEEGRRIVRAALSEGNVPGLSVAVGVGDEIVWAEGFGWANLEHHQPMTPATTFRIGTASMVMTSVAVGLLRDEGRLSLDELVQTHVPEFPQKQWPVTLRPLMAHTSGVPNDSGDEGPLFGVHCDRPIDALPHFADRELLFEPGARFRTSSYGWILVSAAVENAANQPFARFMRTRIFEPLGMRDTEADFTAESSLNATTPYFPRFAADPRYGADLMRPLDYSCYAGASAILSTPSDVARFGLAVNGGALLRPETLRALQTSQRLSSGDDTGYGLGWDLETVTLNGQSTRWIGHNGHLLGGMNATLMTFPGHALSIAVLSNISYAKTDALALKIAEAFTARR